jgi:transcription elongation factor GreA-like protein
MSVEQQLLNISATLRAIALENSDKKIEKEANLNNAIYEVAMIADEIAHDPDIKWGRSDTINRLRDAIRKWKSIENANS